MLLAFEGEGEGGPAFVDDVADVSAIVLLILLELLTLRLFSSSDVVSSSLSEATRCETGFFLPRLRLSADDGVSDYGN